MFILTPATIRNPHVLDTRRVPRRILGRVTIRPRWGAGIALRLRLVFEVEMLRYLGSLAPVAGAALIWPQYALGIAQAPLLMLGLVYLIETRVLRVPKDRREALVPVAERERGLDLLAARGRAILGAIVAGRGLTAGRLLLVVEQSDMARVTPLTLVSVQAETDGGSGVLTLTATETALLAGLFDEAFDERRLHHITLATNEGLHVVEMEARSVSAHARLEALIG